VTLRGLAKCPMTRSIARGFSATAELLVFFTLYQTPSTLSS